MHKISFDDIINLHLNFVIIEISKERNQNKELAFEQFKLSKTYKLLLNLESELYLESSEYVLDMYLSELNENWEEWLKI